MSRDKLNIILMFKLARISWLQASCALNLNQYAEINPHIDFETTDRHG